MSHLTVGVQQFFWALLTWAQYLTRNITSKKYVRASRPTFTCASLETVLLVKISYERELNRPGTFEPKRETPTMGWHIRYVLLQVTSWDTDSGKEQTKYEDGRSFINCVSEVMADDTCDGAAKNDMGECRMVGAFLPLLVFFRDGSYGRFWRFFCG